MLEQSEKKLIGKGAMVMDIAIAGLFFIFMAFALRPHVPFDGEQNVVLWAAITAAPMTGVFWLALQMFRVTLVDQIRRKRADS
jgi:hypothetical protein